MSLMREAANQSTGRLPAVVQRASIQQSAPDPGLVPPHTVQWGHCSLKTGLKTARGMVGFWVFFFLLFTITCKHTLLTQSQVKQSSQMHVILRTQQRYHCYR